MEMGESTKERLLATAKRQFAAKGFYGASIADIAAELDITKQALLYHFKRKEDLYAQVLAEISEKLLRYVRRAASEEARPEQQFEAIVLNLYHAAMENPEDTQILIREMLDNQSRADEAHSWYLVPFLDGLVSIVRRAPAFRDTPNAAIFAFIYQVLGSVEYFVISQTTLKKMYGEEVNESYQNHFPMELQNQIRRFFKSAGKEKP